MLKIEGKTIIIPAGDSGEFYMQFTRREDGVDTPLPLVNGDSVNFIVKRYAINTATALISKTITTFVDGKAHIRIKASDTTALVAGRYVYELELTSPTVDPLDPNVDTILAGEFIIDNDAG